MLGSLTSSREEDPMEETNVPREINGQWYCLDLNHHHTSHWEAQSCEWSRQKPLPNSWDDIQSRDPDQIEDDLARILRRGLRRDFP